MDLATVCCVESQKVLEKDTTKRLFEFLRDNVKWEEGIRSRKGHTRMAAAFDVDDFYDLINDFPNAVGTIVELVDKYSVRKTCTSVYLNYYRDGNEWTPNHTHPGTTQLVVSLGATRTFTYCKQELQSEDGDVLIFGSSIHGIPKEPAVKEGRISIALFIEDTHDVGETIVNIPWVFLSTRTI